MLDKIANVAAQVVGVLRTAVEVLETVVSCIRQGIELIEVNLEKLGK